MKNNIDFRFIDLFAGIGGFHYAVKRVWPNSKCVFASEIDKYAAQTYMVNHNIDPSNDITKTDLETLPDCDLVCAGFPCQPFSRNGKWYNNNSMIVGDDNRANLFLYIIRYASIHKPRFLLLENVKGLTRVKNNDGSLYINTILSNLYEIGYKVVVKVLNSADYGLPQQRKRTFFCCFREISDFLEFNWPEVKDRTVSIANILENNVNEKYWLINRWKGRKNQKSNGTRLSLLIKDFNKRNKDIIIKKGEINMIAAIYGDTPSGAPRQQDKLYSKYGISPTIATFELSIPNIDTNPWRVLTPRECARLQGFPESLQLPEKDTQAYKQCGNAISVPVAQYILESFRT